MDLGASRVPQAEEAALLAYFGGSALSNEPDETEQQALLEVFTQTCADETEQHQLLAHFQEGNQSETEQHQLLAYFQEETEAQDLLAYFQGAEEALEPRAAQPLCPVPLRPPSSPPVRCSAPDPLSMTALQQVAMTDRRLSHRNSLEGRWLKRRRERGTEGIMLRAALGVGLALVTGAFAYVKIDDSMGRGSGHREMEWVAAQEARQAQVEQETRQAVAAATLALTQPRWTDLLSYIKDSRKMLPEIRDHYAQWSYAPFHAPRLEVIESVAGERGLERVHLRVDGLKPWASRIVMEKIDGFFKLDWYAFEGRFKGEDLASHRPESLGTDRAFELEIGMEAMEMDYQSGQGMAGLGERPFFSRSDRLSELGN